MGQWLPEDETPLLPRDDHYAPWPEEINAAVDEMLEKCPLALVRITLDELYSDRLLRWAENAKPNAKNIRRIPEAWQSIREAIEAHEIFYDTVAKIEAHAGDDREAAVRDARFVLYGFMIGTLAERSRVRTAVPEIEAALDADGKRREGGSETARLTAEERSLVYCVTIA